MSVGRMPQTQVLSVSTAIAPATRKRNYPAGSVPAAFEFQGEQLLCQAQFSFHHALLPRAGCRLGMGLHLLQTPTVLFSSCMKQPSPLNAYCPLYVSTGHCL